MNEDLQKKQTLFVKALTVLTPALFFAALDTTVQYCMWQIL